VQLQLVADVVLLLPLLLQAHQLVLQQQGRA
jgi:hypothetical protein